MDKIRLFDIPIDLLTCDALIDTIIGYSLKDSKSIVGHVNTKAMNLAYEGERYKTFLQQCDTVYVDGYGPLLGAKALGDKVSKTQRNTCPDFLDRLLYEIIEREQKIYFLSGTVEVITRFEKMMTRHYPQLQYRAHHGFFDKKGVENDRVIESINTFQPDILYVGFGMPLQEYWILDNMYKIDATVFLPEGACLDFYTGTAYRAPQLLTDAGLEWVSRLVTEPRRLWKRYLIGNPKFLYRLFREQFLNGKKD